MFFACSVQYGVTWSPEPMITLLSVNWTLGNKIRWNINQKNKFGQVPARQEQVTVSLYQFDYSRNS